MVARRSWTARITSRDLLSVRDVGRSFALHLRAENKSARTIETYRDAIAGFVDWSEAHGEPIALPQVTGDQCRCWLIYLRAERHNAPATVRNRFLSLKTMFKHMVAEEELERNPMANM